MGRENKKEPNILGSNYNHIVAGNNTDNAVDKHDPVIDLHLLRGHHVVNQLFHFFSFLLWVGKKSFAQSP